MDATLPAIVFSFSPEGTHEDSNYLHLVIAISAHPTAYNQKMRYPPCFRMSAFRRARLARCSTRRLKRTTELTKQLTYVFKKKLYSHNLMS